VQFDDKQLDNGQHILLGAYSETLRHMKIVGVDIANALLRLPLQMRYPRHQGMDFVAPRLPSPFHLIFAALKAKGLDKEDKMALARFSTTARWMGWELNTDCSVSELLDRYEQTDRLNRLFWKPLCIAALTTSPEQASAQIFLNVLRDSLSAKRSASDMLVPRKDLTYLYPYHAAQYIRDAGNTVHMGLAVKSLKKIDGFWDIAVNGTTLQTEERFDNIIVATQAVQAAALLNDLIDTSRFTQLQHEAITTCYLQYDRTIHLPVPFYALLNNPEQQEWAQFVFDRGQLDEKQAGMLAAVISASHDAVTAGHDALASSIARQLSSALGMPALEHPKWTRVITEKRACFSCRPALSRPSIDTGIHGLLVAGDYTEGDYPSTLEGAVRSGVHAARLLTRNSHK
jgi:squalene-associated FAD-dependent desaturase